ncbi:uncharacterized protein LOC143422599 [Xylocopa sonorina]|uniref:uncharacterized protein LOC143422599 n=1 Tax=Xylocopa sonorina TaxID=1818115 RepID=UPI00403AF447
MPRFLICCKTPMNDISVERAPRRIVEKPDLCVPVASAFNLVGCRKGGGEAMVCRQRRSGSRNCNDLLGSSRIERENRNESGNSRSAVGHVRRTAGSLLVISFSLSFTNSRFHIMPETEQHVYI